jgi:hypothetical protein
MSYIRFFNSNSLKAVRLENYDLLQSDTTRLNLDFDYPSLENPCYYTKILQSDDLWLQFRTDYETITAYIVDEDETEVEITTSIADGAELTDNRKQYELSLDLSAYSGYYYIRFDFNQDEDKPVATYQTEWFEVDTAFADHLKIEWKNGSYSPYDDGVIYSDTQKIWIKSRISDDVVGAEKTTFISENYKLLTTQSQPIKSKIWMVELIPDWIVEKLNIAMQHDYFYINSVRYNSDDSFEDTERQGDTRLYPASVTLRIVEDANGNAYEDYSEDQEITGDLPVIESGSFLINATDKILINATDELLKS